MQINKLPRDDQSCGWYKYLPDPKPAAQILGKQKADWIVIGGGFVGLAAARQLAELRPNDRIVLIEALRIGQGASGRNSGFIIDLPHKRDLENSDLAFKQKMMKLNVSAINWLEEIVKTNTIDCQWAHAGRYQAAVGSRGMHHLETYKSLLEHIKHPYTLLDRTQLKHKIGTTYYEAAIYIPTGILMQPAALVRGLGETLPSNVEVYENSPVIGMKRSSSLIELETESGTITAPKLIMGTNIFSKEFGFLKNRILPIMTFASITRPLNQDELDKYTGVENWGITPADHAGTTIRFTPDNRLLIRNQHRFVPNYTCDHNDIPGIREKHKQGLANRFPDFASVEIEYTWGGACGLTRNFQPFFGKLEDGIYASACHQAVGASRGTITGKLLAEMATEQNSELLADMISITNMPALNPPEPFLSVGVKARLKMAAWMSRTEV